MKVMRNAVTWIVTTLAIILAGDVPKHPRLSTPDTDPT